MLPITKLQLCLLANTVILALVLTLVSVFSTDAGYWRVGPTGFSVMSVVIDSPAKYAVLIVLMAFIEASRVVVFELGNPVLGFSIYNPDKKEIKGFARGQIWRYAVGLNLTGDIRDVLLINLSISQADIAIIKVFIANLTVMVTSWKLLGEKRFTNTGDFSSYSSNSASNNSSDDEVPLVDIV